MVDQVTGTQVVDQVAGGGSSGRSSHVVVIQVEGTQVVDHC